MTPVRIPDVDFLIASVRRIARARDDAHKSDPIPSELMIMEPPFRLLAIPGYGQGATSSQMG
jgi:hypothetical protein